jgi:hypothetical protein
MRRTFTPTDRDLTHARSTEQRDRTEGIPRQKLKWESLGMLLELLLKQCRPWLCPVAVWHRNLFAWRIVVCPIFVLPIMAMMAPLLLYFTGDGRREDISGTALSETLATRSESSFLLKKKKKFRKFDKIAIRPFPSTTLSYTSINPSIDVSKPYLMDSEEFPKVL